MKIKFLRFAIVLALLTLVTLNSPLFTAWAQGTAFIYQGRLNNGGSPASGLYDFRFKLCTDPFGNVQVGPSYLTNAIPTTNGLFTTTIDFGAGIFTGNNYWLEVDVKTNLAGGYTALSPLQAVTPTPYAITAENVVGLTVQQNTNGSPNVIEGSSVNYVSNSVYGATIAGGGTANFSNSVTADFGTVGGGGANTASGWASTVGGGAGNTASSPDGSATVGGGYYNSASGDSATVGGGDANTASGYYATVGGGAVNANGSPYATIGGGGYNFIGTNSNSGTISGGFANQIADNTHDSAIGGGSYGSIGSNSFASTIGGGSGNSIGNNTTASAIPGGQNNSANGNYSFAAGQKAHANHDGAFVWSDDSTSSTFPSVTQNEFAIRAAGGVRLVTSGAGMTLDGQPVATVAALSNVALRSGGNNFTGQQTVTGGKLGIGTTSPQAALHVKGPDAGQFTLQNSADNSSWYFSDDVNDNLVFQPNTGVGAYIDRAGNYHNNSDVRLKQDITGLYGMLDKVLQLRPVSYHFRSAPEGNPLTFGLIAQEVEPLFPEIVGDRAGTKSLAYSELIPVTIRAIQELNQKLNNKDEEIQTLKLQNESLTERLNELEATVKSIAGKK